MRISATFVKNRTFSLIVGIFLALIWISFVVRHLQAFIATNEWGLLVFAASETLQAALFLLRRIPSTVSLDPFDWAVGAGGTFAPFLLVPGGLNLLPSGQYLIYVAAVWQIIGLLALNRSFAVVAANRGIKTSGPYALVRHPLYAGYLPLFLGYYLINVSFANTIVTIFSYTFLFLRIQAEEKHLLADPRYREYARRVPHRLIPFVY